MGATTGEVLLRLRCRGHPAIRATHGKTLEFALGGDITARATCVAGVAAEVAGPGALAPLAGPVRLRLRAGDSEAVVAAVANPHWRPERGVIVRRSGNRYPDTLATDADAGAAGLPRDLVDLLRDPSQELQITVERAAPPSARPALVLLAAADEPPTIARLLAEADAAEVIVAEDPAAATLLRGLGVAHIAAPADGPAGPRAGRRGASPGAPPRPDQAGALVAARGALRDGDRVLVVAADALPGRSVLPLLADAGRASIEVAGLPPALAAAAASPSRAPVLLLDGAAPREARALVRAAPVATRLVVRARAAEVAGICRAAPPARPMAAVTVVPEAPHQRERPVRISPGEAADVLPGRAHVACCLDGAPAGTDYAGAESAGPGAEQIADFARALAREGVPARTVAAALARLPGWSRNRAYEFARAAAGEAGGAR